MRSPGRLEKARRVGLLCAAAFVLAGTDGCPFLDEFRDILLRVKNGRFVGAETAVEDGAGANRGGERKTVSSLAPGARFGAALARASDLLTLVVGAPSDVVGGIASGSAHVRQQGVFESLDPPPGAHDGMEFGAAVDVLVETVAAVTSTWVVVGAPGATPSGAVFVYRRSGGPAWEVTRVDPPAGTAPGTRFGTAVGIVSDDDGRWLAVGAPQDAWGGAVHLYAWSEWAPSGAPLRREGGADGDRFGASVASIAGASGIVPQLLVGAPGAADGAGAAWVYGRAGGTWSIRHHLADPQPRAGRGFGASVAGAVLDGLKSIHVVGSPGEAGSAAGGVHVFCGGRRVGGIEGARAGVGAAVAIANFNDLETDGYQFVLAAAGLPPEGTTEFAGNASMLEGETAYDPSILGYRAFTRALDTLVGRDAVAAGRFGESLAMDRPSPWSVDVVVGAPGEAPGGAVYEFDVELRSTSAPSGAVSSTGAKAKAPRRIDRYLAFRADANAPEPASADVSIGRALRAPFRVEIAAGSFDAARREGLAGGTVALGFVGEESAPSESASAVARFVAEGLEISATTPAGSTGTTLPLPGTWVADLAADYDGATLRIEARPRGSGPFTEVASIPIAGATFRPSLRIDGIGARAEIGIDRPRVVTNGDPPVGAPAAETVSDLIYEAMDRQLEAITDLEDGGTQAASLLGAADAKLDAAATALDALLAPGAKGGPAPARRLVAKAGRSLAQAAAKLAKGKSAAIVTKRLSKAFASEAKALRALAPAQ